MPTADASTLPPMKTFAPQSRALPVLSNNDLALDFIELSFALESGRELPVFTRFEMPITVRVTGEPPASLHPDLAGLLSRLRDEAGIDITRTDRADASITIEAVPRSEIRRALPQAACFVVPGVRSLREYSRARRSPRTSWTELRRRERLAIFVPSDVSPQEVRDCLHEELAQAIGPLNDLYRLPHSVFNDDNVHSVLTGFDMLILKTYYAPELKSGMTRGQVAERLPAILTRLNPAGETHRGTFATRTPQEWSAAVQTALGPGSKGKARRSAATRALSIASKMGWQDHRRAFAHYAAGRLTQGSNPRLAKSHFEQADTFYARAPDQELHRAYVATQLAAGAIARGEGSKALALVTPHLETAVEGENAALLATLLMLRAEALDMLGHHEDARAVRLDSLGWARYGFGPDWAVRAKLREIAALNPVNGRG